MGKQIKFINKLKQYRKRKKKKMNRRALLSSCLCAVVLSAVNTEPIEAPKYIIDLYQCVRAKSPLDCYGLEADSVQSIGGNVVQATGTNSNRSVMVDFNTTTLTASQSNDTIMAAKLRVYKNALTDEQILSLRAGGCNTSVITLQLYAYAGNTATSLQGNVTLTRDDLRTDKWVTFGIPGGVYQQWIRNASSTLQSIAIVAVGTCNARALGFTDFAHNSPLLVAFIRSSAQSIDFLTKGLSEATIDSVERRDVPGNNYPCQLYTYQVTTSDAWSNYIQPDKFEANFCGGLCGLPDPTSSLYTTQHAQLQYFLNKQYPNQVPPPCCVPKDFASVSFIVVDNNGSTSIKTINNLSATSCQCR